MNKKKSFFERLTGTINMDAQNDLDDVEEVKTAEKKKEKMAKVILRQEAINDFSELGFGNVFLLLFFIF